MRKRFAKLEAERFETVLYWLGVEEKSGNENTNFRIECITLILVPLDRNILYHTLKVSDFIPINRFSTTNMIFSMC